MTIFTRDFTQAYFQSDISVERPIFLRPPAEMNLKDHRVLKFMRPIYGIPDSGLHLYLTYFRNHQDRLGILRARMDPCLLILHDEDGSIIGIEVLLVCDSLALGMKQLLLDVEEAVRLFITKPRQIIG